MKADVRNLENKVVGSIELADKVFAAPVRRDLLARVVNWQLAKRRSGNHASKGIGDVSGTTKKPWAQKGTGRARQGSLRSPQFRKGGVIFGPIVRDHAHDMQKKVRQAGLRAALSAKVADGKLMVLDTAKLSGVKTKDALGKLKSLGLTTPVLFIDGANIDMNFALSVRNLPGVVVLPEQGANVYDILRHDRLVLTQNAVEQLEARLK